MEDNNTTIHAPQCECGDTGPGLICEIGESGRWWCASCLFAERRALRARLKTSRSDAFEEVAREYETTAEVLEQAVREKRYPKQDCEMCARIAVEERARAKRVRERAKVPAWPKGTEQDGD